MSSLPDLAPDAVPMLDLLAHETKRLERLLAAATGRDGLLVDGCNLPPPASRLDWLHLQCAAAGGLAGAAVAREEALPLDDGEADAVLLRHALEFAAAPDALLGEASRVLAPGGLLLVAGMHPWSPWRPWLAQRMRRDGRPFRAQAPRHWRRPLALHGIEVESIERFGPIWPGRGGDGDGGMLAAAYLLRARKRRANLAPVGRIDARTRRAVTVPSLAGLARRQSA